MKNEKLNLGKKRKELESIFDDGTNRFIKHLWRSIWTRFTTIHPDELEDDVIKANAGYHQREVKKQVLSHIEDIKKYVLFKFIEKEIVWFYDKQNLQWQVERLERENTKLQKLLTIKPTP